MYDIKDRDLPYSKFTGYPVSVIRSDNRILRPDSGYFSDSYCSSFQKQNFFLKQHSTILRGRIIFVDHLFTCFLMTAHYGDPHAMISHIGTRRVFYGNFYHTQCGNLVFYGHSGDFCHTCLCFYYAYGNIRHTEYGNNFDTIDFHTVL